MANEKPVEGNPSLRNVSLLAQVGPTDIDNADPAITFMLKEEY
jgi:hypothetical protein